VTGWGRGAQPALSPTRLADVSGETRKFVGILEAPSWRAARDGAYIAIAAKTDTPHPKLQGTIHTAAAEIEQAGGRALALTGSA